MPSTIAYRRGNIEPRDARRCSFPRTPRNMARFSNHTVPKDLDNMRDKLGTFAISARSTLRSFYRCELRMWRRLLSRR